MAQKCVSSFIEVWYREQREFDFCIFLYDKRENLKKVAEKLEKVNISGETKVYFRSKIFNVSHKYRS